MFNVFGRHRLPKHSVRLVSCAVAGLSFVTPALAQRASENVVTTAQDAFGTSIGNESIGLYSATEARGFSPKDAGNQRIEGLYYDQQGNFGFGNQIAGSTSIRVGLTAQSYPFPAPTGIADIRLRLPGERTQVSFSSFYGPYDSNYGGQVDLEVPLIGSKLGAVLSVGVGQKELDVHPVFDYRDFSGLLHFTPDDSTEVIAFANRSAARNGEGMPLIFTGGAYLPPKIDRGVLFGPDFVQHRNRTQGNLGVIARSIAVDNWRLQAAVFRSFNDLEGDYAVFYRNTQPNGVADLAVRANAPPALVSTSGEVRASGLFAEGPRRHTIHLSAKGRLVSRTFGGDDTVTLGTAILGVPIHMPMPTFKLGPQSRDDVHQGTVGASYVTLWPGIGEISAGLQKSFYRRAVEQPGLPRAISQLSPWLYNGTAAAYLSDKLTLYAGYTRGLEESGIAPLNASNPGEALPASLTEQVDAGVRYKITPGITVLAGVFDVRKPYFDRDTANLFTQVGSLRHRGIELSLSGQPLDGLKVVAGVVLLQARVSGSTVDRGLIGEVPPGRPPGVIRLNANYGPSAWRGFSVNAQVNYEDAHAANRLNTLQIETSTVLDLGARYDFKVFDTRASFRVTVNNLTDEYVWTVAGASGQFSPSPARRFTARFAADF